MSDNSFNNLVKDLADKEKEDLLAKVNSAMPTDTPVIPEMHFNANSGKPQKITPELDRLAKSELSKMNFVEKLIIKFQTFFLKKDIHSIILAYMHQQYRHNIESAGHYVDFDKKLFTIKFVKEIFEIYSKVVPLRPVFQKIWVDPDTLENIICTFLNADSQSTKASTSDFVSDEVLLRTYTKNFNEDDVKKLILRSTKTYIDSIPDSKFKELREQLIPFYNINLLVTFPFYEIFTIFGDPLSASTTDVSMTNFKATHANVILDYLYKFAYSLKMGSNLSFDPDVATKIFESYYASEAVFGDELKHVLPLKLKQLRELNEAIRLFNSKIIFTDIFRYFQNDPFFTITTTPPRLDLKSFYTTAMRNMVNSTFQTTLKAVHLMFIENSVNELFTEQDFSMLNYYIKFDEDDWLRLHLPVFKHTKSMMLAYTFVRRWYKTTMAPIVVLLNNTVLTKSAALQNKLTEFKNGVEVIEDKIRRFDNSLAPETEAGQTLNLLKASVRENTTQLRLVRSFIGQKDIEAFNLLKDAYNAYDDFNQFIFNKIIDSTVETIQTSIAGVYPSISRNKSLNEVLKTDIDIMNNFTKMIKDLITYESIDEISS